MRKFERVRCNFFYYQRDKVVFMRCPFCRHDDTQVKETRTTEDGAVIRRRRVCTKCACRFTTAERIVLRDLIVVKTNGRKVPFDRDKLTRSIRVAMRKRPFSLEQIDLYVSRIVHGLESSGDTEIPSTRIGEKVMQTLKELDRVAYLRFASVYRDFRDTDDFSATISDLHAGSSIRRETKLSE